MPPWFYIEFVSWICERRFAWMQPQLGMSITPSGVTAGQRRLCRFAWGFVCTGRASHVGSFSALKRNNVLCIRYEINEAFQNKILALKLLISMSSTPLDKTHFEMNNGK